MKNNNKNYDNDKYIAFLDESGDLGINGTNNFVISIIILRESEYAKLKRILKKIKNRTGYLKKSKELKSTKLSKNMKLNILKNTNDIDYAIYSIVMDKKQIINESLLINNNINTIYISLVLKLLKK
ncbi:MAG: hypothetical protein LBM96_00225 [Methanobrevibacter sp.]|jgi:hypothetical protein|nr:hypothetical protein [Candidatus Methanoflexus mossambicus]